MSLLAASAFGLFLTIPHCDVPPSTPAPYLMKIDHVFETVLYAEDLAATKHFYQDILQLDLIMDDELFLVFKLKDSALIIFNPNESEQAGREVPSHGSRGPGHIAFTANEEEFTYWQNRLTDHNIEIEQIVTWSSRGGRSLYFRDPAGNSLEFAPANLWW